MAKYLDLSGLTAYDAKIKAYADAAAAGAASGKITMQAVNTLPAVADAAQNVIYLVPNSGSGGNIKDEYILVNGAFELIGTTAIDISGKADKVSNATSGNFAGLDSNGNLTDSGKKASDFATAAQGAKADTALQPSDMVPITYSGAGNEIDALFVTTATFEIYDEQSDSEEIITYEPGMTWAQWIASEYNELGFVNDNGKVYTIDHNRVTSTNEGHVSESSVIDPVNDSYMMKDI